MSTATQTGAAPNAGATIIPFPRRPMRVDAASRMATEAVRAQPVIEWGGGWYHDAAIAEERVGPHS